MVRAATARVIPFSDLPKTTSKRGIDELIDRIAVEGEDVLLSHLDIVATCKAAILKSSQQVRAIVEGRGDDSDIIGLVGQRKGAKSIDIPGILQRLSAAAQRIIEIERKARGMDQPGSGEKSYEDRLVDFMTAAQVQDQA